MRLAGTILDSGDHFFTRSSTSASSVASAVLTFQPLSAASKMVVLWIVTSPLRFHNQFTKRVLDPQ